MKNLLALIGLAVVLVGGLGWYLGWYQLGSEPASDGHRKITVDVNPKKIAEDVNKGEQKFGEILSREAKGSNLPLPALPPLPAPPVASKNVEGTPTGLTINPDGSATISFPPLNLKSGN